MRYPASLLLSAALAWAGGCGADELPDMLPATIQSVNRIRDDDSLSPQEMRDQLEALGIDPVVVNGLLRAERTQNQFGGDLRSAFEKVSAGRFTELTPDEVQVYGDATGVTSYTDTEAQLIVDFFGENDINTADGLKGFLDDPANALPPGIDETNLRGVFVDFDPVDVIDDIE